MNEMRALVEAFDAAAARGERCAIATVVGVEGSSYRRPGARMLVAERGETTGTISAGCLESDVAEHARRAMRTGHAALVEYDTTATSDDDVWGFGLGCGGVIRVLVEPVDPDSAYIDALRRASDPRSDATAVTVATVYRCAPSIADADLAPVGARVCIDADGTVRHERMSTRAAAALAREIAHEIAHAPWDGVLVETLVPPVPLLVFGAGFDVVPVVELARGLGWRTEVVDPQARPASRARFAADRVTLARVEDLATHLDVTPRTMALLMSHNYAHDLEMLRHLLASPARYIGVMGPRHRTERMLADIATAGHAELVHDANLGRLHAPVGLDIGATGPADIALSILGEMRAVLGGRCGGMLRDRQGGIHDDAGGHVRAPSPDTRAPLRVCGIAPGAAA